MVSFIWCISQQTRNQLRRNRDVGSDEVIHRDSGDTDVVSINWVRVSVFQTLGILAVMGVVGVPSGIVVVLLGVGKPSRDKIIKDTLEI